jgi:hypothetical protein
MEYPEVMNGANGLQIWRVAANLLNMHFKAADKGWFFGLGAIVGNNPHSTKYKLIELLHNARAWTIFSLARSYSGLGPW